MITEIIEAFVWFNVLQSWGSHFRSQFWFGLSRGPEERAAVTEFWMHEVPGLVESKRD